MLARLLNAPSSPNQSPSLPPPPSSSPLFSLGLGTSSSARLALVMSASSLPRALSALSFTSTHSITASESEQEDWDRSLVTNEPFSVLELTGQPRTPSPHGRASGSFNEEGLDGSTPTHHRKPSTPRNTVVFPGPGELYPPSFSPGRATRFSTTATPAGDLSLGKTKGRRTLSALLRLHSEKGCEGKFSAEEAARIADVLGQWVGAIFAPSHAGDSC